MGSRQVTALDLNAYAKADNDDFKSLKETEILFIDDMGEEPQIIKSWGNEIAPIIELLYYRYDRQLMTVITSNKTEQEIRELYGVRISDRLEEMFDKIYFEHESFRK